MLTAFEVALKAMVLAVCQVKLTLTLMPGVGT